MYEFHLELAKQAVVTTDKRMRSQARHGSDYTPAGELLTTVANIAMVLDGPPSIEPQHRLAAAFRLAQAAHSLSVVGKCRKGGDFGTDALVAVLDGLTSGLSVRDDGE